ncbi:MAG: hypothetical protein HUJ25_03245 [Crocinitomicaceae bacterium]|nr:hypothetical protein [Crocinitomicaceae bacterium]
MKKFGILTLLLLGTGILFAQYEGPGQYLDAIGENYKNIQKEMWDYTSAAAHGKNARTVDKKRVKLIQTTKEAKSKVRSMKGYEGNTAYRDSVVSFLNIYYLVLTQDYAKIVDMEDIAEQSYDLMEAYMLAKEEANNKLTEASEMLIAEQKKFAEQFDVELVTTEDELSEKMRVADEVYDYYNKLYLIFFKSYVSDIYLSDAIAKGDVSAIEQNKSALSMASADGLSKLKSVEPFKGDNSLVAACQDILKFYQDEADNQVDKITNYLIKTENFNTIKASFDQKKEKDRTQEDIDQYNNAVKEANEAAQTYNSTNQTIFENRKSKIAAWNEAVQSFTDKHVPKK